MALIISDLVKETTTTTGTGAKTLAGARAPAARTVSSVLANGDTAEFTISHDTANEWEIALYTYASGPNTLTRVGSPLASSNAGAAVNFSAGTKKVDLVLPASRIRNFVGPVQIGATSFGSGSLSFSDLNGVSWGLATNSNGGTVTASVVTASVTPQLGVVSHVGGGVVSSVTQLAFSNSGNVSWNLSTAANAATAFASVANAGFSILAAAAMAASNSFTTLTDSSLSAGTIGGPEVRFPEMHTSIDSLFSYANVLWRFQTGGAVQLARQAAFQRYFAGSGNNVSAQQVSFAISNNVSFGITSSTFAGFGVVPIYSASASDVRLGIVSHVGGNVATGVAVLAFQDASNVTWNLSTAAGAATVRASVAAGGGGGITAFALSNAASSVMATGLTFSNANGFSFLLSTAAGNAATLSASYSVPAVVNSGLFQLTNSVSAVNASQAVLSAANGFSFLLSTAASGATLSGSYTVPTLSSLSFSNLNGVSFGIAGSTLTASVQQDIGLISHIGGNQVSSVTRLAFSNASNVTFSLSTAANAATLIGSVAAAGGFTFSGIDPLPGQVLVDNGYGQNSVAFHPVTFANVQFDRFAVPLMIGAGASTTAIATLSASLLVGLYTRNASTLSLQHSTSFSFTVGVSSNVNSSLYAGQRYLTAPWTTTVTQGQYWYGFVSSTNFSSQNLALNNGMISQSISNFMGILGSSITSAQFRLGNGFFSATSASLPGSVAFSQIQLATSNQALSMALKAPALFFQSGTA
jgi:hypothetical protein